MSPMEPMEALRVGVAALVAVACLIGLWRVVRGRWER